jgi:cell division protein FtsB
MHLLRRLRFDHAVTVGCLAMLGYFAWHAWQGPRGFSYRDGLAIKLAELQTDSAAIVKTRQSLEGKVSLMRPDHVDPDLLEELARSQLDMAGANDLVVRVRP